MDYHSKIHNFLANIQFYWLICNMKQLLSYILLIIGFVSFPYTSEADTEFQLTQFTTADGLANNTVRHIMQDSKGNIWICTSNGLSYYDGQKFNNFHPLRNSKKICLTDQRIRKAFESDGYIWIATAKGVSCLEMEKKEFVDYNKKGIKVPDFPKDNIHKLTDKQGRIWEVTENDGLFIINKKTGDTEHFTTTSKNNPIPTNALKCIFQDKDGVIWIGTDNLGISQIKTVQNDGVNYMLEGENIRMLMHLGKDRIAVSNRSGDTWIYDSSLKSILGTTKREKSTYCILKDKEDNIWEGTKGNGLYINGEHKVESPFKDIYAFLQDNHGDIWIGTFGAGLFYRNKTFLTEDNGSNRIRTLIEDEEKHIWVGTSNGVFVIDHDIKGKGIKKHLCVENGKLYSNEIRTMFKDSKGNIYIAETGEGFAVINTSKYIKDHNTPIVHVTAEDSLANTMVQSFVEDKEGFVWIATEFGISKYNPVTRTIKNYFFSKNMLNNVYSENCGIILDNGNIAFGTNNGIVIINPSIYNKGEKNTNINAEDITINGQQQKKGIIYVVSKWWKSPWAISLYCVVICIGFYWWRRVKKNNTRFHNTIKELNQKKDRLEAEKEEIREQYSSEIKIRREADKNASEKEFISKIESIANNELGNASFTADDFAVQMGLGRTVFFNKMKATTGYSPKEYMKLKRIKRAAELITTTATPIGEIAFCVGIEDPLYFSRVFKQHFGMSPTEWRNKNTIA